MQGSKTMMALALVTAATSGAQAAWMEARTSHFTVYSNDSEEKVRDFATKLERFDRGMRRLRNLPDAPGEQGKPLTVFVVPDVSAVERLCINGMKKNRAGCSNVAGFYDGRASGSVAFTPRRSGNGSALELNAQTVLFHEYTHHFMLENYAAAYPAWFVEGFAEFNGTASFDKDGSMGFGKPALHRYYGLFNGETLPLLRMLAPDGRELKDEARESLYGRGWLLTHYLTFNKPRKGQLSAYLAAINAGTPSRKAAETAFGDLHKLDTELDAYLRQTSLAYLRLAPDSLPIGTIDVRPLSPGEAAMMPVRLRSRRGVDADEAARVVVDARRIAAPYPNDVHVQDALAEAECDAGNDDAAEAAADRAIALDASDGVAMIFKGRTHVRRAAKAKATDPAVWKEARSWFVKANRIAKNDAEPLMLFYQSFAESGQKPTANAIVGLEYAFQVAPQDDGLRWMLARQYLLDDKIKEARIVLGPLAFNPHAPVDNPAATLIALIDKGDMKALMDQVKKGETDTSGS